MFRVERLTFRYESDVLTPNDWHIEVLTSTSVAYVDFLHRCISGKELLLCLSERWASFHEIYCF